MAIDLPPALAVTLRDGANHSYGVYPYREVMRDALLNRFMGTCERTEFSQTSAVSLKLGKLVNAALFPWLLTVQFPANAVETRVGTGG